MTKDLFDVRKIIDRYVGIPLLVGTRLFHTFKGSRFGENGHGKEAKKILVVYLSGIGDTVMLTTCVEAIAKAYPTAHISFLSSSQNHNIVKDNPYLVGCHRLETTKGVATFFRSLTEIVRNIQCTGYDLVLDFEQFLRLSAIMCLISKAKITVGFRTRHQSRHLAYTHTCPFDPSLHTLKNFCRLLDSSGIATEAKHLTPIAVTKEDRDLVTDILTEHGISNKLLLVGIHPGSGGTATSRRWKPDNFGIVADRLITDHHATVVFTGSQKEWTLIEDIRSNMKYRSSSFNLAGKLTLSQLPAAIQRFSAFVSNDTGPLHIAAAMQVPVVALFGPNTPSRYGPIGRRHQIIYKSLDCSPCIIAHEGKVPYCRNNRCMREITPEEVCKTIENILTGHMSHSQRTYYE